MTRNRLILPLCLLLALALPLSSAVLTLVFPTDTAVGLYSAITLQEVVLWLLPSLFFRPWRIRRFGIKQTTPVWTIVAVIAGISLQLCVAFFLAGSEQDSIPIRSGLPEWIMAMISMAIVPAVCEEAFFRGCVAKALSEKCAPWITVVVCGVLFALMHADYPLTALPVGIACTLLFLSTGRVWPGMVCHLCYNAAGLLFAGLTRHMWMELAFLTALASLAFLCIGVTRRKEEEHFSIMDAVWLVLILLVCVVRHFLVI